MSSTQNTKSQLHVPRLVLSHNVHEQIHGSGPVGRFNTWLAVRITKTVGSTWIAQTFFQLVLLPIIIVGQNVIQAANDARAEADHETLSAVHQLTVEVHAINEAQTAMLRQLQAEKA